MAKTWLITGASSGFGHALAKAVLERGDRAVLVARRREPLAALVDTHPDHAHAIALDITDGAARGPQIDAAWRRFDGIDVLANIAGRGSLGAAEEFSDDELRDHMELNFFAQVAMARASLPHFRAQGHGHLLNLTSIGGLAAFPGFSIYCAAKFALEGWSEALRGEVAPLGIRVTIVEPGAFRTAFAGDVNLRPAARIDAYRPVIAPVEDYLYGDDGKQPGDPAKAAAVMIEAVEAADPPLRLVLGADALGLWDTKRDGIEADIAAWRERSVATAFDGVVVRPVGG